MSEEKVTRIRKSKSMRIRFECLECGKTFLASTTDPRCPKCRGCDVEPKEVL